MEKLKKLDLSEETKKAFYVYAASSSYSFMDEIRYQQEKCEENCIKEVIKCYMGKPLTIEDTPKVQRIFRQGDYSKYILAYNDIQLGMIRYINNGRNFTVEFTPKEVRF